jgi:hypothetical protein
VGRAIAFDVRTSQLERWLGCMRRGDFDAAWDLSDASVRARAGVPCWHLPRDRQSIWNGTPIDGKRVLVRCYHGLGDTVQFIRYAPMLRERAREVLVWAQPSLLPLLFDVDGIDALLPLHDGTPAAHYDVDVEVMELAHVFRSNAETLPRSIPYLRAEPSPLPPRDGLAVGVVWKAGDWNSSRSVPPEALEPLFGVDGVTFFSLQRDETHPQLQALEGTDDPLLTARLIRAMDLVISVDTFPAHLAGALGARVWTLLPEMCDWRWMEERGDTPWYPTMRLFRQQRQGDWSSVFADVVHALRELRDERR